MAAPVPNKFCLQGELDSERFGGSLIRVTSTDNRPFTILRLPRNSLALHGDWQHQVRQAVQLRHPHIMQVHELFLDEQYLNVVLDGCTGSLQQHLQGKNSEQEQATRNRLTEERARWLFQQLVLAVDYLHSNDVTGLNLQDIMLHAPATSPDKKLVRVCCPLIKLASSSPSSTSCSTGSPWLPALQESEQLADIAACGVVLLNMLGGRLQDCSWGYSKPADVMGISSGSASSSSVATPGTTAAGSASAEAPYLLPADYERSLTRECQRLLQRLLSCDPLSVVLSTTELLQDKWVQHNFTPAAASLNQKCRNMRPLWKAAEQQLPGILAEAATTELGFYVWQRLPDMLQQLEGNWQQELPLDASLFGCSNASIIACAAPNTQQQHGPLWAYSLLLPGTGMRASKGGQPAEHVPDRQWSGAADGQLLQTRPLQPPHDAQQRDQHHQDQHSQRQDDEQPQQSWAAVVSQLLAKCHLFTQVPCPAFMAALQQLFEGQRQAADSSSRRQSLNPIAPVVGMCLKQPVLLLEQPEHGTLAAWLVQQQQEEQEEEQQQQQEQKEASTSSTPIWPMLQQLLLDVAEAVQAMHRQTPPLVHGCINAGAVHLLQPLLGAMPAAVATSTSAAKSSSSGRQQHHQQQQQQQMPSELESVQQQQRIAQLSLLWPWRQAVSRSKTAHPWLSAPEVLQHAALPTPASDVYGLGMLMLQLLTGWVPGMAGAKDVAHSSGWSLGSPVPGAALAAAGVAAESTGDLQHLEDLCADLQAMCGLSWSIPSAANSSSSSVASAALNLPAGFMGLMWRCLSADPAARPLLAQVMAQLKGMDTAASKAQHQQEVSPASPEPAAQDSPQQPSPAAQGCPQQPLPAAQDCPQQELPAVQDCPQQPLPAACQQHGTGPQEPLPAACQQHGTAPQEPLPAACQQHQQVSATQAESGSAAMAPGQEPSGGPVLLGSSSHAQPSSSQPASQWQACSTVGDASEGGADMPAASATDSLLTELHTRMPSKKARLSPAAAGLGEGVQLGAAQLAAGPGKGWGGPFDAAAAAAGVEKVPHYTGVQWLGSGRWRAQISMGAGKMLQLGTYTTAQEAALVFNKFARVKNHFMTPHNSHKLNQLTCDPLLSTPLTPGAPCVLAGLREGCAREFSKWLQGHQAVCVLAEEQGGSWTLTVTL